MTLVHYMQQNPQSKIVRIYETTMIQVQSHENNIILSIEIKFCINVICNYKYSFFSIFFTLSINT